MSQGAETPLSKWGERGGGGGADITLNKLTCLFAIVKSGLDQTSKCSSCRLSELYLVYMYCNLAGSVH